MRNGLFTFFQTQRTQGYALAFRAADHAALEGNRQFLAMVIPSLSQQFLYAFTAQFCYVFRTFQVFKSIQCSAYHIDRVV